MQYLPMILTLGTLFTLAVVGCQTPVTPIITHKLVATGNQHAVPVYPDEQTYLHTSREKQAGGVVGIVGDVKQNLTAKIDDQTPVQIVTSDDYGAVVTVTDGPMKGATGFVAKQNVD